MSERDRKAKQAVEFATCDPYSGTAALAKSITIMVARGEIRYGNVDHYVSVMEKRNDEWAEAAAGVREYLEA